MNNLIYSLCERCNSKIQAQVIIKDNNVYYRKKCTHTSICSRYKPITTLISTDADYYLTSLKIGKKKKKQKTNMCIIELTDDCKFECTTCIANSAPGGKEYKTVEEICEIVSKLEHIQNRPETIMLSGGEPTIHPNFWEILDIAYKSRIERIILITNGITISEDENFSKTLAKYSDKVEVYLQFDSLEPTSLENIRGFDLSKTRINALSNLEKNKLPTTLVCVIKKGINDSEVNSIIEFSLSYKCVKGLTLQPIKITGRHKDFTKEINVITLSEIRRRIIEESKHFDFDSLIPHPVNPVNISIGYLLKSRTSIKNVTKELFSSNGTSFPNSQKLRTLMYFTPKVEHGIYTYDNLFRLTIVSYMDIFNYNYDFLKLSNIGFINSSHNIISLDEYYLFECNTV